MALRARTRYVVGFPFSSLKHRASTPSAVFFSDTTVPATRLMPEARSMPVASGCRPPGHVSRVPLLALAAAPQRLQ